MKTYIFILTLALILNSCNNYEGNNSKDISSFSDTLNKEKSTCANQLDLNKYYYSIDTISFNPNSFIFKNFKSSRDYNIGSLKDSLTPTEPDLRIKIKCGYYFSNNSFSDNFHSLIFYDGTLEGDGSIGLILFNISANGKIISNLILTSSSGWENGSHELNFDFINDSTIKTIYKSKDRETDSTGRYLKTWVHNTFIMTYKISEKGEICIVNSDTIIEENYLRFSDFVSMNFYKYNNIKKTIRYPLNMKVLNNISGRVDSIIRIETEEQLPWDSIPSQIDIFNPNSLSVSPRLNSFNEDSACVFYENSDVNFGFIYVKEKDWRLKEIYGFNISRR